MFLININDVIYNILHFILRDTKILFKRHYIGCCVGCCIDFCVGRDLILVQLLYLTVVYFGERCIRTFLISSFYRTFLRSSFVQNVS